QFAEYCAKLVTELGCDASLFEGPQSTPQLSFAERMEQSQPGGMLTASHNPPHDNGYKVYFDDGAQVVGPHAGGIIDRVNAIGSEDYEPVPVTERGEIRELGEESDELYISRLESVLLAPKLLETQREGFQMVFTP